jgi:hypothetical protein
MLPNLDESMSTAEDLSTWCSTTPYMNAFQPIAASAVEVCRAADLVVFSQLRIRCTTSSLTSDYKIGTKKARILAAHAVTKTEKAINRMAPLPLSPEVVQTLAVLERYVLYLLHYAIFNADANRLAIWMKYDGLSKRCRRGRTTKPSGSWTISSTENTRG